MQKTSPTLGRVLVMVCFALSCFGLLLFLWVSFGGTVPLKPKGYRFQVAFPEATQLGPEAAVRISGVDVGKVRDLQRDPRGNRTLATIELDNQYAPIPADAKAILRQKTLLGETYVELTPGLPGAPKLREGGRLPDGQVKGTVEFDEILNTFDAPTRRAFRTWQQEGGSAIMHRGQDLNQAIGQLPVFLGDGTDLLRVLDTDRASVHALIKNTGVVFSALTQRQRQLHDLIVNTHDVFRETATRSANLTQIIKILPTFLTESRKTFRRTEAFAQEARPVVRLLRPPTRDLGPTVQDLRLAAPDLQRAFVGLKHLIPVAKTGVPALAQVLRGTRPVLQQLGPFLSEVNPLLEELEQNQYSFGDFFTTGANALADTLPTSTPGAIGHYLRQFGPQGVENVAIYRQRLANNRGDSYPKGVELADPKVSQLAIGPSFDCRNAGFEGKGSEDTTDKKPSCWVAPPSHFQGHLTQFPHVDRADYSHGPGTPGGAP
jgi:phospholipid/cholesterol/gamma-HCH transport system substrate-binding protein